VNENQINPKLALLVIPVLLIAVFLLGSFTVIKPGHRGVRVTLGKVSPEVLTEGLAFKWPLGISKIEQINVQQQTGKDEADCFSKDTQTLKIRFAVFYRIPADKAVTLFQEFKGDPYETLIAPRVQEALKQVTAQYEAIEIVGNREKVREQVVQQVRESVAKVVDVVSLSLENIDLSNELERAIDAKMVMQEEARKKVFEKQKQEAEAEITLINAKAEAESVRLRGQAFAENPLVLQMEIIKKWNGISPGVVVLGEGAKGSSIVLPMVPAAKPEEPSDRR
jgi:prohibitin 2